MIKTATDLNSSLVRHIKAKVELYDSSSTEPIATYTEKDRIISIDIERIGEQGKFFGVTVCQKLNLHLRDVDRELSFNTSQFIKVYFTHNEAEGYYCNFPLFHITETHRDEKTNELSITAYDKLYGAAAHTVAELGLEAPYIVDDLAVECANFIGATGLVAIGIDDDSFLTYYENGANYAGEETLRAVITHIAEATQSIAYLDYSDRLVFKRPTDELVLEIDKSYYYELKLGDNKRLATIVHTTELGDNVSATTGVSGSTQYVRDNPLWNMRQNDIATLVDNALAAVGGLTIAQFECEWRGDYALEIGDNIGLLTKDNQYALSYVINDVINYDGSFKQSTQWHYENENAETHSNPSSLGDVLKQTIAKVDKQSGEITLVAQDATEKINDVNDALRIVEESVATLTVNKEEVNIKIDDIITNGVDRVETSTGFTFNDDGLKVSKTGSEMETQITEDGMTVYKSGSAVLTANNEGVDAVNLKASTYLIIGNNSRFEDYGGRTGCFGLESDISGNIIKDINGRWL